jgi:hypothetical protein
MVMVCASKLDLDGCRHRGGTLWRRIDSGIITSPMN